MDTENDLEEVSIPGSLFRTDIERPSEVRQIIEESCPVLQDKVCCVINWSILRKVEEKGFER